MIFKTSVIASILNESYAGLTETTTTDAEGNETVHVYKVAEDLSNVADFGRAITSGTTTFDNLWLTFGNVIDKVVKTMYMDTEFESTAPPCYKNYADFIGLKEILHINVGDYLQNETFADADENTFEKVFGEEIPEVSAKYFGKIIAYSQKWTESFNRFQAAFTSPSAMTSFFTHLANEIEVRFNYAIDRLQTLAFNNAVLNKATSDNAIVSVTTSGIMSTLSSAVRKLRNFNTKGGKGFVTSTPKKYIRIVMVESFYNQILESLADVRHPELLPFDLNNITVVPFLQNEDYADTVIGVTGNETTEGDMTVVSNVAFIVYDERVFACTYYDRTIKSVDIPNKKGVTNYFDLASLEYFVNTDLPMLIGYTDTFANSVTEDDDPFELVTPSGT